MSQNSEQDLGDWVYAALMEWTCQWAAWCDDEKAICDAIIQNIGSSGLRYGIPERRVRRMLQHGGGMCSGWYRLFQQLAHCQGVFVHRRCFLVHWRDLPRGEVLWCALVIRQGGLNQPRPTHPQSEFHDNDTAFPVIQPVPIRISTEWRYRFWGERIIDPPDWYGDGHCVNFLEYAGRLYLYDASFGAGPFEIAPPLPPADFSIWSGSELASFKASYLDQAVDYMLGSLYNGRDGEFYESNPSDPRTGDPTNGMSVRTSLINGEAAPGVPGLSFYWGG